MKGTCGNCGEPDVELSEVEVVDHSLTVDGAVVNIEEDKTRRLCFDCKEEAMSYVR